MINVRAIANTLIQPVNPDVAATLKRNTGYTTLPNGKRVPVYTDYPIRAQVQALSAGQIEHLDGLNIQGVMRNVRISGTIFGLVRVQQSGGDVIEFDPGTLPEGDEWLCVHVLEQWPSWVSVAVTLQNTPSVD